MQQFATVKCFSPSLSPNINNVRKEKKILLLKFTEDLKTVIKI